MSLILDALKKSEAERQRQSGPTLLEVRITQPRRRYPAWVIAVGALLAVNLLLLLAFLLHRPAGPATERPAPAVAATAPAAVAASLPAAAATPPTAGAVPAALAPVAATPSATRAGAVGAIGSDAPGSISGNLDTPAARAVPREGAGEALAGARNPADDEPAVPPAGAGRLDRASTGRYANLPSFSDMGGDLPALRLDLHVYAYRARDRYALINMQRVHEGDALPEGPRVLAITRDGVALDYHGQEFMLRPQ